MEFIKNLNINRLKNVDEGTLVNYISISMNNKYNSYTHESGSALKRMHLRTILLSSLATLV